MIRIMTATEPNGTSITVDGDVAGECADVIEAFVKQPGLKRGRLHLHLRDVTSLDDRGRALLRRLAAQGVRLTAEGVYCSYVVAEISRPAA